MLPFGSRIPPRTLVLAWHRDRYRSQAAEAFVELAQRAGEPVTTPTLRRKTKSTTMRRMASESRRSQMLRGVLDLCLLAVVVDEPAYGYEMTRRLRERGLSTVGEGSIYPLLGRLERDGLVATHRAASDGGPPRKYYRASPSGTARAGRGAARVARRPWRGRLGPGDDRSGGAVMPAFIEECRYEWKRLGVPDSMAEEMATELEADLAEAEADGVSAAEILGESDPRRFAATWARERGLVSEPAPPKRATATLDRGSPSRLSSSSFSRLAGARTHRRRLSDSGLGGASHASRPDASASRTSSG